MNKTFQQRLEEVFEGSRGTKRLTKLADKFNQIDRIVLENIIITTARVAYGIGKTEIKIVEDTKI
jgi:hypothetical protein